MREGRPSLVLLVARQELLLAARSRWTQIFGAVFALFERFRGRWEIFELPRNERAIRFWRRVVGEFSGGRFTETTDAAAVRQVVDTRT